MSENVKSEMRAVRSYAYQHPRLGLLYVDEWEGYSKHFPKDGWWSKRQDGLILIALDAGCGDKEAAVIEMIPEISAFCWRPDELV